MIYNIHLFYKTSHVQYDYLCIDTEEMPTFIPTFKSEFINSKDGDFNDERKETVKMKNFPCITKQVKILKSSHTSIIQGHNDKGIKKTFY